MNWLKDKNQDGKLTVAITVLIASLFVVLVPFYPVTPQSQPQVPTLLPGQSATLLADGRWLLVGGESPNGSLRTAAIWNPTTGRTTRLDAGLRDARAWHTATVLPDGTILIFGGLSGDNQVMQAAEVYDPSNQTFSVLSPTGLTPRARHTATLLTDGRVLVAGGVDAQGATLDTAELWDFFDSATAVKAEAFTTARKGHSASLTADGTVLLKGGTDSNGNVIQDGDLFDPATGRFTFINGAALTNPPPTENPILVASIPTDSSVDVPIDVTVALRFSKPLRVETVNADTITLSGPKGVEQIKVVPAEGGMLAFITLEADLLPGVTYNVTVNGVTDPTNVLLPLTSIGFMTAQDPAAAPCSLEAYIRRTPRHRLAPREAQ